MAVFGGGTGLVLPGRRGLGNASPNAARTGTCGLDDGCGTSQAFRRGDSAFGPRESVLCL